MRFGSIVKRLREERGMTQTELGELIGVTKAVISKYETAMSYPPYDTLVKIADLFRLSTDYLLGISKNRSIDISNLTDTQVDTILKIVGEFEKLNSP